jgi:hypothetical protein
LYKWRGSRCSRRGPAQCRPGPPELLTSLFEFHLVCNQSLDLAILHSECVTKHRV